MQPHYTPNSNPIPATSGIYRIVCLANTKPYVGSAINLYQRQKDHFSALRGNRHPNRKLQHAWNKYGEQSFIFEVLELVIIPELLTAREQYWFSKLKPFGRRGFNIARTAGSNLGMKASPATRERLRISHLGQPGYWTGKKRPPVEVSPATRTKISIANQGHSVRPATREKLRLANLGKKQSEKQIRNAAEARRGKKRNPASVEKSRLARTGQKRNEESVARMIAAKASSRKTLIVTSPDGVEYSVVGIRQFCKEHHLDRSTLMRVAKGIYPYHKGWKARYPETDAS